MDDDIKALLESTITDVKTIIKRLRIIEGSLSTIQKAYVQHGSRLTALERQAIFSPIPTDAE